MPNSSKYQTGEIYLVKFHPGYGSEFHKYRPAVIVSGQISKIDPRYALIAPFTSSTKIVHQKAELLIKGNPALSQDSVLLCWYLWTIDSSRLIRKLGELSNSDFQKMQKQVTQLILK